MKVFFCLFYLCLSLTQLEKCIANGKERKVFIFDFDHTIVSDVASHAIVNAATEGDQEKVKKIEKLIAQKKKETGGQFFVYMVLEDIGKILGRPVNRSDIAKAKHDINKKVLPFMPAVIKKIKDAGHDVFIIGGGYGTCDILLDVAKKIGVDSDKVYSGPRSVTRNGEFVFSRKKLGFANCRTGHLITNDLVKSNVVKELKRQGKIKGKVIHTGDGENDLEVYTAKEAEEYIGFGVDVVNDHVKKEAPHFVTTPEQFESLIEKMTQK